MDIQFKFILASWLLAVTPAPARCAEPHGHEHEPAEATDHGDDEHGDAAVHHDEEPHDGRILLSPEAIRRSGVRTEIAGPVEIASSLPLVGRIVADPERMTRTAARFAGVVREVRKRLGDPVARGEVVAVVESDESLQRYEVRAAHGGTVLGKHVTAGEVVGDGATILTIADLSAVSAEFHVHPVDLRNLRPGQPVFIQPVGVDGIEAVSSQLDWIAPVVDEGSRTTAVRAGLGNSGGVWRPGEFVRGAVTIDRVAAAVAVRDGALQRSDERDVVYVNDGDAFEATPVVLGRRGGGWVEVLDGLRPGQRYVSENSFLIKADGAKHGASHDH